MSTELDRLRAAYRPLDAALPARTRARVERALAGAPRRARRRPLVPALAAGGLAVGEGVPGSERAGERVSAARSSARFASATR